jgi:serine/threonine protein kinase
VLLAERDGGEWAFLTDFGVTKQRSADDTRLTGTGIALGSVDYMAPEQAEVTELDARTDVYALGCVLFHALTGSVPFIRGNDLQRMWAHVNEPPPAPSSIEPRLPRALDEVVGRALAKDPADRQQSAGALAREARAALAG